MDVHFLGQLQAWFVPVISFISPKAIIRDFIENNSCYRQAVEIGRKNYNNSIG